MAGGVVRSVLYPDAAPATRRRRAVAAFPVRPAHAYAEPMTRTPSRPVDEPSDGREAPAGDAAADGAVPVTTDAAAPGGARARLPARIAKRAVMLGITGVLALPRLPHADERPRLGAGGGRVRLRWFFAMAVLQVGSVFCQVELQRIALRSDTRLPVLTSLLAGAAFGRVVPGDTAAAATIQYGMLVRAGIPTGSTWGSPPRRCSRSARSSACRCSRCRACCSAASRPRATSSASCGWASACSWSWPAQAPSSSPTSASCAGRGASRSACATASCGGARRSPACPTASPRSAASSSACSATAGARRCS